MGTILSIDCLNCAYSTEVYEGEGEMGIQNDPMECRRCEEIVAVPTCFDRGALDRLGEEVELGRCQSCGGDEFQTISWFGDERGRLIECPKCRGRAAVENAGIWD